MLRRMESTYGSDPTAAKSTRIIDLLESGDQPAISAQTRVSGSRPGGLLAAWLSCVGRGTAVGVAISAANNRLQPTPSGMNMRRRG